MFREKIIFLAICSALLIIAGSAPPSRGRTNGCYGYACPEETVGCIKKIRTSNDLKTLDETVGCVDKTGQIIEYHNKSISPNPYGPRFYAAGESSVSYRINKDGKNEYIKITDWEN